VSGGVGCWVVVVADGSRGTKATGLDVGGYIARRLRTSWSGAGGTAHLADVAVEPNCAHVGLHPRKLLRFFEMFALLVELRDEQLDFAQFFLCFRHCVCRRELCPLGHRFVKLIPQDVSRCPRRLTTALGGVLEPVYIDAKVGDLGLADAQLDLPEAVHCLLERRCLAQLELRRLLSDGQDQGEALGLGVGEVSCASKSE
jgi:hypothetical protein